MSKSKGYWSTLRLPRLRAWAVLLICQRFTVAAAPIGLIFLGNGGTGSLAHGSMLLGAHAIAEAICAAPLGRRFDRYPMRREFGIVLTLEAVVFLVAGLFAETLPFPALLALAALGGGVASGAHGGLRALALRLAPDHVRPVIGLESAISTLVWMAAPAAATALAVGLGRAAPAVSIAVLAVVGVVTTRFLSVPFTPKSVRPTPVPWARLMPACVQSAAAMLGFGGLTVALFGLLPLLGVSSDSAGAWLSVMAAMGVVGGIVFGSRSWPGHPVVQTAVLLAVFCITLIGIGVSGAAVLTAVLVTVVGLLQPAVGSSRSLAVQEVIPQGSLGAAFSATYASAGLGYGVAGMLSGAVLPGHGPRAVIIACGAVALVATLVSAGVELRYTRRADGAVAGSPAAPADHVKLGQ